MAPPLVQSVAFDYRSAAAQDEVFATDRAGYVYGRYGTPTTAALELALAELDGTAAATCFVSGMAAIAAFVDACAVASGGRIVAQEDIYGQVRALFERWIRERGAKIVFVDATDHRKVEAALRESPTTLLYIEAMANPLLRITDIAALAKLAHSSGATLAVDATFASPVLLRPAELGADVVIHSLTKYVNGHGDVMAGSVAGSAEVAKAMRDRTILDGAYLPPHEAWLCIRGMRTLDLRVRRQCESALHVAQHLARHPKIARVRYPGLPDHPQHELARRQMKGFGGMLSFDLGSLEAARRLLNSVSLLALAESLGGVESLISHPATMTHASVPPERRAALGITDGLVRISAGIEDIEDLEADLAQALDNV